MIKQWYAALAPRVLIESNYATYNSGLLHPTRTMAEHDFVYIVTGGWEIGQGGINYSLQVDDVILLHANTPHYGITPCIPGTKTIYLHFLPHPEDRYNTTGMPNDVELPTVISCRNHPRVKELFSDIAYTYISSKPTDMQYINAMLNLLLIELRNAYRAMGRKEDELVAKVIRFLQENSSEHYIIEQLSQQFYVNRKTLDRRFLKTTGKSVYRYQRDLKLEAIKRQLIEYPAVSLQELAKNYGFYDEFHLSRTFKAVYGISPATYRKHDKL